MPNCNSKTLTIQLNSLIHRIDSKESLLARAASLNCRLKRIRRSKNWMLTGSHSQVIAFKNSILLNKELWIKEAIDKELPKPVFDLDEVVKANPAITVHQLMSKTECTLAQARSALDNAEGFE
ncbi:ribosome recycling factor family protein [Aliivibrio kagoshimensis]|uniref:ribosome recycling factor family protein n=1 Tax=Aliivibrio kagoshimensis TaxID=2910230 RepID=UPI003D0E6DD0